MTKDLKHLVYYRFSRPSSVVSSDQAPLDFRRPYSRGEAMAFGGNLWGEWRRECFLCISHR